MKKFLMAGFAALLIAGCVSGPPPRDAEYWKRYVEESPPQSNEDVDFFPQGEVNRDVALDDDDSFHFKFIETVNHAPLWVMEVRDDKSGYFIFNEGWIDGAIPRSRNRKVDFTLSADEYGKVRSAILDSGFLSVRNDFSGSGSTDWNIGLSAGGGTKAVKLEGAQPNEARKIVYGVYEVLVKPRYAAMVDAPVFEPEDWQHAPEYQPLR
ncbi:MAG: hypothetical protein H6839_05605 [Planctomycetes bacterium]|nr:hypothetical protein [Planctomycetota bacterium]